MQLINVGYTIQLFICYIILPLNSTILQLILYASFYLICKMEIINKISLQDFWEDEIIETGFTLCPEQLKT